MKKLLPNEVRSAMALVPGWRKLRGELVRVFEFADFPAALRFVNRVGRAAERVQHHPDIDIRWNKVTLRLVTHDAGGLTEKDFALARHIGQTVFGRSAR